MFLKSIFMKNFKSYGKRSLKIDLSKNLTVISGPNGSGKSNVTDAIDFVLSKGRSAKKLRAKNYAGLVFDGGEVAGGSSSAEVRLIFDNADRQINIEKDEVTFTKKVKIKNWRKGQEHWGTSTYYYINDRASSSTEFRKIFSASRLSTHGFNIVKQGTVNNIAEKLTPRERRKILDDIAGVTSLDDAIRKSNLEKEDINISMDKLDFFIGEIKGNLKNLAKERDNAKKHFEFKEKIKTYRAVEAFSKKNALETSIAEMNDNIKLALDNIESSKKDIYNLEMLKGQLQNEIIELVKKIDDMQDDETRELVNEIRNYRLESAKALDRKMLAEERIEELRELVKIKKKDIEAGTKELNLLQKELQQEKERSDRVSARFKIVDEEYQVLSGEMSDASRKFSEINEEIKDLNKKKDNARQGRNQLEMEKEGIEERIRRKEEERSLLEESMKNVKLEVNDNEWQFRERREKLEAYEKEKKVAGGKQNELKIKLMGLKKRERDVAKNISRLNKEFQELRINKRAAEASGYGLAVTKVLDARDEGELEGIHGTIAQLAEVDKEYETALSTAAGGGMQAIVVDDDVAASKAMMYLRKNRFGRAMFLPLNKMLSGRAAGKALMVSENQGVLGFAIDLVKFSGQYKNAFWYIFRDTLIVKDLATARANMGGVRLITLDGQVTERGGAMIGGSQTRKLIKFGKSDNTKYEETRTQLDVAKAEQNSIGEELHDIVKRIGDINNNLAKAREKISKFGVEMKAYKANLGDFNNKKNSLLGKDRILLREIEGEKDKLNAVIKQVEQFNTSISEMEKNIELKEEEMIKSVPEKRKKKLEELKLERTELRENILNGESSLKTLNTNIELHSERIGEKEKAKNADDTEIAKLRASIDEARKDAVKFQKEAEKREEVEKKLIGEISKLEGELRGKKDKVREGDFNIGKKKEDIESKHYLNIQYNTNLANLQEELEEIKGRVNTLEMEIKPPYPSPRELSKKIDKYQNKLDRLGPVNMVALEKYEYETKRKDDLLKKYIKLKKEKKALTKMVKDIKKEKKDKFMEVFDSVNNSFRSIYPRICNNGEGHLIIENEEDPFDGGLIIKARPPGAKMRDIMYISGGEKSQVAIAFILSLQQYDPSPMYILDEIDQNLDRINSEIIIQSIQKYSKTAQFILISLHKDMISYADTIYGCYRKKGISEMVSIHNVQDIPA